MVPFWNVCMQPYFLLPGLLLVFAYWMYALFRDLCLDVECAWHTALYCRIYLEGGRHRVNINNFFHRQWVFRSYVIGRIIVQNTEPHAYPRG